MGAFEGLHPGQFIVTDPPFALFDQFRGALIQVIEVLDFLLTPFSFARGQPIADQLGFEIALFLKGVRPDGAK